MLKTVLALYIIKAKGAIHMSEVKWTKEQLQAIEEKRF